ncbi:unnamed protein product [Scytosiphon promiscuus]
MIFSAGENENGVKAFGHVVLSLGQNYARVQPTMLVNAGVEVFGDDGVDWSRRENTVAPQHFGFPPFQDSTDTTTRCTSSATHEVVRTRTNLQIGSSDTNRRSPEYLLSLTCETPRRLPSSKQNSATTPSEDRAHRSHVEGLCQNPEYRAKLAAVRINRREMVTSLDSLKEANARVREAVTSLRAAEKQAVSAASVAPAPPADGGSQAMSVADASERLDAAAEAAMKCRETFRRVSSMRRAATAEARQVRLRITQGAGNSAVTATGAAPPREQALASGTATANAAAANAGRSSRASCSRDGGNSSSSTVTVFHSLLSEGRRTQPRQGGWGVGGGAAGGAGAAGAAANATKGSKSSETEMPAEVEMSAEHHALEEGRSLV